ncbi:P-loop containing nucleoside triphosphate hydrolase protein [Aspergillus cavernicola]|uniref:P-loop containing nucleoside triphosphate hydrolase protein n=1 Tax=Aspergillus cavernicola TaxID=176166 RepID=A0ABR4HZN6_9EURO
MERFLLDNVKHYQSLVSRFSPPRDKKCDVRTSPHRQVAIRIRPILEKEIESGQVAAVFPRRGQKATIDLHEMRKVVRGPPTLNSYCFSADKVFGPDQTTATIYDDVVKPLLPWVFEGGVGTLFAYGQTGSGKTFTVSGLETLMANDLFGDTRYSSSSAKDSYLLNDRAPFQILEDAFGTTQLAGTQEQHVTGAEQFLQLIAKAASFRQTAPTAKNAGSSRSHAICRVRLEDTSADSLKEDGILYMIDLAGSEAARDIADHTPDRMKETREVNVSLSTLKDCIRAMTLSDLAASSSSTGKKGKKPYIPFRQSALTKVLKHLFDPDTNGNCKTVTLACINPSFLDVGASKNTLRYAEMLRVALPKSKALVSDPAVPTTWANKDVKNFIKLQSGSPTISPYELAPHESGLQLLRLPLENFVQRCLKSPDATEEQAKALHAKLWAMHVKSQRPSSSKAETDLLSEKFSSSREQSADRASLPFKDRIRPGMVIRWVPPEGFPLRLPEQNNLALVLTPRQGTATTTTTLCRDGFKDVENAGDQSKEDRYLCAMVFPGALANAYEVNLWRQVLIHVDMMEAEVVLEYDNATRYYYLTS